MPLLQILLKQPVIADSQRLGCLIIEAPRISIRKRNTGCIQRAGQLLQDRVQLHSRLIHLVDEEENRDMVMRKKSPERAYLAGHAIRGTDDQNRVVQDRKRALHFR